MSQRPPLCRTFNTPQGCRFGNRCKFLHDRSTRSSQGTLSPVTSPPRSRCQTPLPQGARVASGVPRNVCQFFWSTGACARGFECSFRHVKQSGPSPLPGQQTDCNTSKHSQSEEVDFFSTEGLTAGSTQEDRHSLNPSDVHNHLKEFTHDKYRFDGASQIHGFVRLLGSINDNNKAWNTANTQEFLEVVVKGNALHRIGEILRFEPVRASIGSSTGSLSFQRGYFPIFQFFATDLVLKSTLHKNINHLYSILMNNHEAAFATLKACLGEMMQAKSWMDRTPNILPSLQNSMDGIRFFRTLSVVFLQYFNRYKNVVRNHCDVAGFIQQFADWFDIWANDVCGPRPQFKDLIVNLPAKNRELSIAHIREDIQRLQEIVERETGTVQRLRPGPPKSSMSQAQRSQALAGQLAQTYDPPGDLRKDGRRHDNDFANIRDIRISPTHEELFSAVQPYLPVFRPDAPHHLPMDSMERHLDIQFRLLREDLISSTRASMAAIQDDLLTTWNRRANAPRANKTILEQVLQKNGGAYRTTGYDSVFFQIYTNVEFLEEPPVAQRRGVSVTLVLDAPAVGSARDADRKKRYDYWEHSKRLQGATLVTLVVVANRAVKAHLGVVSSYGKDLAESSKHAQDRIQLRVVFFDPEVELRALQGERLCKNASSYAFLVDNSVMFESARPFLEKMQTLEPTQIPFTRYIAAAGSIKDVPVMPPKYSRAPGFKFRLQCLAKKGKQINDLDVLNPAAVTRAREQLRVNSVLDPSQADAVVDTLSKEVSLIQGPPGTGKSYTAKEILRVLFASKIRPIVLIAFTNHALDHMVTSVLDANITNKIVRLGTRSTDERIMEYTLDKLEKVAAASNLDRSFKRQYAAMKKLEEEMSRVMTSIRLPLLDWDKIQQYLKIHYPDHADAFEAPPFWIVHLTALMWAEEEQLGEWQDVQRKGGKNKEVVDKSVSRTLYGFWRAGKDIQFLQSQPADKATPVGNTKGKGKGKQTAPAPDEDVEASLLSNPVAFFASLGFEGMTPPVPARDQPLVNLLADANVWGMSVNERVRLATDWEQRIRMNAYTSHLDHYKYVRDEYREACKNYDDLRDESRRRLLSQNDLIACTTTGAASLTSLLESVGPQVLLVEEAGQVLEAHILASLVPSVRHLICIGDPQQLRPTLANYSLSMDSERGKQLFMFDRSMMERLVDNGFEMSQINVQRRMRPAISHFIRSILYPKLEDNAIVLKYPSVQGMQTDVFFYNHLNKEGGSEDSVSKYNMFEVEMIRDLVLYFLRQGAYSGPGDIAVLCAYLGQLQKVRAALRDMKISVAVDERDAEELARQGLEEQVDFEEVLVSKHVRLGTVDIFQGQEAKIVIVSLVRNSGQCDTGSASIGFLKSSNRINVALSRAKHGLYVMGNAANLRRNSTWSIILDGMEDRNQIGCGFPIRCPRHPAQASVITKPGQLSIVAPVGGCLLPCGFRMNCGHICPSVCHAAPDNHRSMRCTAPCNRTPCPRKHPCPLRCSDDCGQCMFPMYGIGLPCGHTADVVPCHQLENLTSVRCAARVQKQLPGCEHFATMPCHLDPVNVTCMEQCNGALECCTKSCKAACGKCQLETLSHDFEAANIKGNKIARVHHIPHPCERPMYCQHNCGLPCSREHECNTKCKGTCRQQCVHHCCPRPCSEPCAPCMEPCVWSCAHFSCPVLCGSICSRLPCDEPCTTTLPCGHQCPSVCGEPCQDQRCVVCLDADKKADIVDFIMQRRLEEIDLQSTDVSDRLITLSCGHIYTVETLDGHCGMSEYYELDKMGRFVSTKLPPVNYQSPPMCPTCRGPITALRYGRVTKRATLDILEQNVASTMSGDLDACNPDVSRFTTSIATLQEDVKKMTVALRDDDEEPSQGPAPWLQDHGPLPATALEIRAMQTVHGVLLEEARAWNKIIKAVLSTYRRVVRVANTRGAHVKAYESALTTLYRLEMKEIANDPARATNAPEPLALAIVNRQIGQPPPKADVRFQVEAYFLSLELRSLVAQIAQARVEALIPENDNPAALRHRALWAEFVGFLYASCIVDAKKARDLADNSSATRQAARGSLFVIRYEFELFRWKVQCRRTDLFRTGKLDEDMRKELAHEVQVHKVNMSSALSTLQKEYIRKRPSKTTADMREERKWVDENCRIKVDAWRKECDALEEFLLKDGFYQPITLQERADIVKAFGFSHRGHFYNCENGHTFVITECGGAMEASRCPECRAPIGGSNHNIHASNTRATDFENIARETGSLNAPWPWARDA
ncbi:hypothetical protein BC628DRAFT_1334253 [Trametes gibbosa]|uniref:NFX1-type zinc finger-containing protein 1 n=1 Tax=Trametes gibbosa TaxID=160864 RepID=A0A6G6FQ67_9APHY|nr:hypothetical protein BC628DRAFT_1334253 [Trametes gibbosa]QIE48456.1 hypothetical protein [Trametes gibbosa]